MVSREKDPWQWQALIALGFALLVLWHLGVPSKFYFDEVHYVPAARAMLAGRNANAEHPLLGKEAIALAIWALGDGPWAWRLPSALMGIVGLFAFGRALWWASGRRVAAIAGMALLASDFLWYVQSRIAMLDMAMAGFAMLALWMAASAVAERRPVVLRLRLIACGLAFALALGAKWSVAPVMVVVIGGLLISRMVRRDALLGVGISEMFAWLVALPVLAYWLTFWPAFFYTQGAIDPTNLLGWHREMLILQSSVTKHHPYQSVWSEWIINWRPIWYLYERVDGAQRGVLLVGNPLTMLAGLVALGWCGWTGWRARAWLPFVLVALYVACLLLWALGHKPVQFYYHYLLPSAFLMAALALALDALWRAGGHWRREAIGFVILSLGLFGWFWPILSAAALGDGANSFQRWMWLPSWL
jgi:dolichyl-phosphate-mannose-protein mannosyltransferase